MPCALPIRSEEHTSELQSPCNLVCRLLLEKKKPYDGSMAAAVQRFLGADMVEGQSLNMDGDALIGGSASTERKYPMMGKWPLFFFNDTATTEIYTLSLHDALPICFELPNRAAAELLAVDLLAAMGRD